MTLARARLACLGAYALALAVAALVLWQRDWVAHPYWRVAIADVCATLVVFGFSVRHDNSSFYDAYWSVTPIAMSAWWLSQHPTPRGALVLALIATWGVRLTYNWTRHWRGIDHEDWRYVDLRHKVGRAYWLVSLFGLHLFPTVLVLAASYAAYLAIASTLPLQALDAAAFAVTAGAIAVEATADQQLHAFRRHNTDPDRILDTGLWRYARHPNYFGETTFWWGLALFALAALDANPRLWWPAAIGPAAITAMFLFISIPMIDAHMLARHPRYEDHLKHTSSLLPWPPKRRN